MSANLPPLGPELGDCQVAPGKLPRQPASGFVSPDLDAYAAGAVGASEIQCALCQLAPCNCPEFGSPAYFALIAERHGL